jgi:hypothetical protein
MKGILGDLNGETLLELAKQGASACSQVDAAVAYARGKNHPLLETCKAKGRKLTFYGLLDEHGAVGPDVLRELLSWDPSLADARLVRGNFHPKVIWWRGFGAYVGSANLTEKAWFKNIEAGIFMDDAELLGNGVGAHLDRMFEHLAKISMPVTPEVVDKLETLAAKREELKNLRTDLRAQFEEMFLPAPVQPSPIKLSFHIRWQNSGAGYKQYRIWTGHEGAAAIANHVPVLAAAIVGREDWKRQVEVRLSGGTAYKVVATYISDHRQYVINGNRRTPLGDYARRWMKAGEPSKTLTVRYSIGEDADVAEFDLPNL